MVRKLRVPAGARSILILAIALSQPLAAMAQDAGEVPAVAAGAELAPSPAISAPQPAHAGGPGVTGMPSPSAAPTTEKRPPRLKSTAPPLEMTVSPGDNTVFSVALFHVNRIVTPFRAPEVRTSSAATMTVESGIVYVTTQTEVPIGLFVFDKANPEQAISLTLNPAAISPVSVKLSLAGYTSAQPTYGVTGNQKAAANWETESPYVQTVKELFKELAGNKVPQGYGLTPLNGRYTGMPTCSMPGLQIEPLQLVEGAEITAVVARVTNQSYQPLEINEAACQSGRLIGVAAWPRTLLNPGDSTELYVALQAAHGPEGSSQRPSVIGRRGY